MIYLHLLRYKQGGNIFFLNKQNKKIGQNRGNDEEKQEI